MPHRSAPADLATKAKAILFDMNRTFVFNEDRFGLDEDFFETYRSVGGTALTSTEVRQFVVATIAGLSAEYSNPELFDSFPTLREGLARYSGAPSAEYRFIEAIVARHEVGAVPMEAATVLQKLAKTHRLGVVSNIWAAPENWESEFVRAGIAGVFETRVFSSTVGAIKPSLTLFRIALEALRVKPADVLFVGDSLSRDIVPAKHLGMSTAWVSSIGESPFADTRISSIAELVRHAA